jgi:hypothetical protein
MCFSPKMKTPKQNTNLPAPTPVLAEDPKGIDFGGEESGAESEGTSSDNDTAKITKIERKGTSTDVPSALSTASSSVRKKSTMSGSAVRNSMEKPWAP